MQSDFRECIGRRFSSFRGHGHGRQGQRGGKSDRTVSFSRPECSGKSPRIGDTTVKWLSLDSSAHSLSCGHIARRLCLFTKNWAILGVLFVLVLLKTGYHLIFIVTPPMSYKPLQHLYPDKQLPLLRDAKGMLLAKNTKECLGTSPTTPCFNSPKEELQLASHFPLENTYRYLHTSGWLPSHYNVQFFVPTSTWSV